MSTRYSQLTVQEFGAQPLPATDTPKVLGQSSEINRLLTAAVVSRGFRQILLANPMAALTAGYRGESFCLNAEEMRQVTAIRAASLQEFALQLLNNAETESNNERVYETYQSPVRLAFSS